VWVVKDNDIERKGRTVVSFLFLELLLDYLAVLYLT